MNAVWVGGSWSVECRLALRLPKDGVDGSDANLFSCEGEGGWGEYLLRM